MDSNEYLDEESEMSEEELDQKIKEYLAAGIDVVSKVDSMSDDEIEVLLNSEEEEEEDDDDDDEKPTTMSSQKTSTSIDFTSGEEQNYDDLFSNF